ncbi:MAG TPA: CHASE3 domain-containing protein [Candidatus Acidoferrales bacterium]|nr:CHASE3 domain-containing protein [Candidatus Acidoferrales bacterium]
MNFKGKVVSAFGLASAVLLSIAVLSYRSILQTTTDEDWVAHTHFVREELDALLADLTEAQASERSYILADGETYSASFEDALARVRKHVESVRELTQDNPHQQASLQKLGPLLAAREIQMRRAITARRTGGLNAAIASEGSNDSRQTMDQIRAVIAAMLQEEGRLLAVRATSAEVNSRRIKETILFGYGLAFVFLIAASMTIHREMEKRRLADKIVARRSAELEAANNELEAFCYSVSHDLRTPLRGIDGFSQALLEDYGSKIDSSARDFLQRIRAGTQRMGVLIDDLLNLSRFTRIEMQRAEADLSEIGRTVVAELRQAEPQRDVEVVIAPQLCGEGDPRLMRVVLQNLLANSWKFTSKKPHARIEFGRTDNNGSSAFYVKDNGAGFDPRYTARLFGAFQRLHGVAEFPGSGVGLAMVQRIIQRHGGRVWAEGAVGEGATFYFTL